LSSAQLGDAVRPRRKKLEKTARRVVRMYDMTSTPAYEVNQETIIAPRPRGNKLEIAE
jgi:GTP cyclohydrolase I